MTNVQGDKKYRDDVIGVTEFQEMLRKARDPEKHPYYLIRDPAILCILWLTGKRAAEVASIQLQGVATNERPEGHANYPELKKMVEEIKPKKLIPVHTEHPELFKLIHDKVEYPKLEEQRSKE